MITLRRIEPKPAPPPHDEYEPLQFGCVTIDVRHNLDSEIIRWGLHCFIHRHGPSLPENMLGLAADLEAAAKGLRELAEESNHADA